MCQALTPSLYSLFVHYPPSIIHYSFNIHLHSLSTHHPLAIYFIHLYTKPSICHIPLTTYYPSISPSSPPLAFHESLFQDIAMYPPSSINHLMIIYSSRIHYLFTVHLPSPLPQYTSHYPSTQEPSIYLPSIPPFMHYPATRYLSTIRYPPINCVYIHIYLSSIYPFSMDRSITIIHRLFIHHPSILLWFSHQQPPVTCN